MGCQEITEKRQIREFFDHGQSIDPSFDIHGLRELGNGVPVIRVGNLILENRNNSGSPIGLKLKPYQVVTLLYGTSRIAVTTSPDSKNSDENNGI